MQTEGSARESIENIFPCTAEVPFVAIPTAELSGTVVLLAVLGAVAIPTAELSGTVVLWAVLGAVVCYDLTQVFLFGDGSRWRTLAGVRQKALTKHLRFGQRTPYNSSRMQ